MNRTVTIQLKGFEEVRNRFVQSPLHHNASGDTMSGPLLQHERIRGVALRPRFGRLKWATATESLGVCREGEDRRP